ncbi:uncharacterized protein [Parasteatoda tepidariorum]|uniref:uncharacterized protein n=1 Tax=Parasteatoda tepidariorum TaxID=114398 RepID=UPI001C71C1BD|nr:uncharacterized protein LOC107445790 [Parasteatoda tepidariorum]
MQNTKDDISRITETVSLCRRVANTIRKCMKCETDRITKKADVLKRGFRERKFEDLNKLTSSMLEVDFHNFNTCCAYMVTYAACYSELTYIAAAILQNTTNELHEIIDKQSLLTITSINGGPGNDLLGFLYSLCGKYSNLIKLNLNIIDSNIQWQVFFSTLMSEVEANGNCNKLGKFISEIKLSHKFVHGDATHGRRFGEVKETLENSDLVLMVQTLSLMTMGKKIDLLREVLDLMKRNAIILIVDSEWPSLVAGYTQGHYEVILNMKDLVACTKPSTVYNCQNITVCVADAIALKKL